MAFASGGFANGGGGGNLEATTTEAIIVAISCVIIVAIFIFRYRIGTVSVSGMQLLFTTSMLIAGIFFTGGNLLTAFVHNLAMLIVLALAYQRIRYTRDQLLQRREWVYNYNQNAEEVASRLFCGGPFILPSATHVIPVATYNGGRRKKLYIPKSRVRVIIGKGGKTIKQLESQSGAKIEFKYGYLNAPNILVELKGTTPQAVASAEELINQVLAQHANGEISTNIPNSMVGLIIGHRGETIKYMQDLSGARIQVIPLDSPPIHGMPTEMKLKIVGAPEQIESAKQLISEIIRRSISGDGGYSSQQGRYRHQS